MDSTTTKNTSLKKIESTAQNMMPASPVGLGIFGAIAGAAVGAVAAIYLSDEKNRSQFQKQVQLFRDKAIKVMDTYSEQEKTDKKISRKLDDVQETVHTIQK